MKSFGFALLVLAWMVVPAAQASQEIRIAIISDPNSLDPAESVTSVDETVLGDLFEGLTVRDPDGGIKPGVASQWNVSGDGRRWTFILRPEAKWSNGEPVTAEDFVYAWRRLLTSDFPWSKADRTLRAIKGADELLAGRDSTFGATARDPHTLVVELESPNAGFAERVARPSFLPVPRSQIEKYGNNWAKLDHFVSNGPFELSEWVPLRRIILRRATLYWDKSAIKLDKLTYVVMEDVTDQLKRFQAGDIDITSGVPLKKLDWARSALAEHLSFNEVNNINYVLLSLGSEPWTNDVNIRRAMSLAIDRTLLTEQVLGGRYRASQVYVPTSVEGYTSPGPPDWPKTQEDRNKEAKRLWALKGAPRPTKITVSIVPGSTARAVLPAIAQMWRATLGVETQMEMQETNTLIARIANHNFVAAIVSDVEEDAESFLRRFISSGSGRNEAHYISRPYDELLAKASLMTGDEQAAILAQAETLLLKDAPIIPILQQRGYHLVADRVKGFRPNNKNITFGRDLSIGAP